MLNFTGLIFHNKFNEVASKKFQNAQSCVDNEVVKRLADYTPIAKSIYANYGKMSHSHKVENAGVIVNTEPTARKEYYTNKGKSGGMRGKLWLERMKADHKDEILRKVKENFK